jgi:hypothetical protein
MLNDSKSTLTARIEPLELNIRSVDENSPLHLAFVSLPCSLSFVFAFFDRIFRRHCGCSPELVPRCTMFKVNPAISDQIFLLPLFNFLTPDFPFPAHMLRGALAAQECASRNHPLLILLLNRRVCFCS